MLRTPVGFILLFSMILISPAWASRASDATGGKASEAIARKKKTSENKMDSLYSIPLKTLSGEPTSLEKMDLKGKVLLIVNTASECGYTPQYKGLQALQEKYSGDGFAVLGFPSNDFGAQEPGTAEEIGRFCDTKYRVRFPLFEKNPVKGSGQQPMYTYLVKHAPASGDVSWNFEKFLVGRDGKVVGRYKSKVEPESAELKSAIEDALKAKK